jgi:hypothetical protein
MIRILAALLLLVAPISYAGELHTVCTVPADLTMPDGTVIHGLFHSMTSKNGKLTNVGVAAPGSVDAVITGKGKTFLVWAEPSILTKEVFADFQDKINAYVAYASDGRLAKQYPDAKDNKVIIYLVLFCKQPPGRLDNLRSISPQMEKAGFGFVIREDYK